MAQFTTGIINISTKTLAYDPIVIIDNLQTVTYFETDAGKLFSRLYDGVDMNDFLFDPRINSTTNGWYMYIINSDPNANLRIECINSDVTINGIPFIEIGSYQSVKLLTDGVNFFAQAYSTTLGDNVIGIAPTTDNALVRWVGTGANVIQNSLAILDDSGNLTGLTSLVSNQINVGNLQASGNSIISTNTNGNIVLDPNGTGIVTSPNAIKSEVAFVLEETGVGTDTITLQAPTAIASSYTLTLPVDDGLSGQTLTTDGSGNLSWQASLGNVTGPLTSTDNAVSRFDGTTGQLLQNSAVTIDDTGNTVVAGTLTTKTSLLLEDPGAGTNTVTLQSPSPLASSYTLTLPTTDGNANQLLQTNGFGVLNWVSNSTLYSGGVNPQTGVGSYQYVTGDNTKVVTRSNAGALMTDTLPAAGASFPSGWSVQILNLDPTASIVLTVTSSSINNGGTLVIGSGQTATIVSDNVNYWASVYGMSGTGSNTILSNQTGADSLTTGIENIIIGAQGAPTLSTGSNNTFIGSKVAPLNNNSFNTFVGYNTGRTSTGTLNTFVGHQSAFSLAAGDNNTMIGGLASRGTLSGNGNIFIGADNGPSSSPVALNNVIVIGTYSEPTASGQFVLASTTYPINTTTSVGGNGGADELPTDPLGYLEVLLNGTLVVIPYYNPAP